MTKRRIAVIGSGLAGLATVSQLLALGSKPTTDQITLFEGRSKPGGRAGAFIDAATGETLDLCQHVAMGCCDEFQRWLQQNEIAGEFRRNRTLYFLGPGRELCPFTGSSWLPAPLHLAGAFLGLRYFNWREKLQIALVLRRLVKSRTLDDITAQDWFLTQGTSYRVLQLFWEPVIVSALSESVDQVSIRAVQQVFALAFWQDRHGYELLIPYRPLTEILLSKVWPRLIEQGVTLRASTSVQAIAHSKQCWQVTAAGEVHEFDIVVLAVPWDKVSSLLPTQLRDQLPELQPVSELPAAPISSVHFWTSQRLTELPHVVLPGRISQWLFACDANPVTQGAVNEHLYQVVISAAYALQGMPRQQIIELVWAELSEAFSIPTTTQLLRAQVIQEPRAVFAPRPGVAEQRPATTSSLLGLFYAGDWTATGWPATMESAVRSGRLAAEQVMKTR